MARYSKAAYVEVSTLLRLMFDEHEKAGERPSREDLARVLADVFEQDNTHFDRRQFYQSVGVRVATTYAERDR
jgi:hypothetical protein